METMQPILAMVIVWVAEKVSLFKSVGGSMGRAGITGCCFHHSCLQHNLTMDIPQAWTLGWAEPHRDVGLISV